MRINFYVDKAHIGQGKVWARGSASERTQIHTPKAYWDVLPKIRDKGTVGIIDSRHIPKYLVQESKLTMDFFRSAA